MAAITVELIDALLNPVDGRAAERQFQSIPLPTRVHDLFTLLIHTIAPQQNIPRCMLACVLLRRDISSLGGYACVQQQQQVGEVVAMLGAMVDPLLGVAALGQVDPDQDAPTRRQLGFVVAEVCSTLSLLDDGLAQASVQSVQKVLNCISSSCSMAHKPSLDLLATLAQRAPFALAATQSQTPSLPDILQHAAHALPANSAQAMAPQLVCANSILEAMTNVSAAFAIAQKATSTTLSNNLKERMVQMIRLQTMNETNPKKLTIDSNSIVTMMGKSCLSPILQLIVTNPTSSPSHVQTLMQTISQCASTCPSLLAGDVATFASLCQVLLCVASRAQDETKLSAVEALVTLLSVPDVTQMLHSNPNILHLCVDGDAANGIQGIVHVCAGLMVHGVDDNVDLWAKEPVAMQEDAAHWEYDDHAIFAESILESFLQSVGGSRCLSAVLSLVETLLSSNQWQQVKAGLSILEICLTSAPYTFSAHVPVAVEAALSFASNPCVRVQFQAVQLLGALCRSDAIGDGPSSSGRPELQIRKQHGNRILAAFVQLLDSCPKVVGHVCLAIVSYCRGGNGKENAGASVEKDLVLPFMGDILTRISSGPLSLNVADNVDVFIRAFAAIACLADVSMEEFAPFYNSVMPGLLECANYGVERDANNNITGRGISADEMVSLRGGAIEAATIVGQAVGASQGIFHPDAEKLMQLVLPLLDLQSAENATIMIPQDQLLAASARIACVMEAAYAPFLPRVLPHMLKKATEKADVSITDGDESSIGQDSEFDEDTGMESLTISLPGMGAKKMVLNTTQMQEKSQVARAIYEHANSMGAAFGPYARACIEAFVPLISFQYASDVRSTAAQALGPVFDSACEYALTLNSNDSHIKLPQEVFAQILLGMAKQLIEEEDDDIEALCAFSEAMSNITYSGFSHSNEHVKACMSVGEAREFVTLVVKAIDTCLKRRSSMIQMINGEYLDEDSKVQYEDILSCESEYLSGLIDSIGYTLKSLGEAFMPIFDSIIAPFFGPLLKSSGTKDSKARFGAVCLFDDCVEHCGSSCVKYAPTLANAVQEGINDKDLGVREASVYGISQIARKAPKESLQAYAEPLVQKLAEIARDGAQREKDDIEDIRLVENSSSALATMTLFNTSPFKKTKSVARTELVDIFMSNLPLQEDFDEAKFCHDGMCDLVESGELDINTNLDRILNIMGEIADAVADGDEMATQVTVGRFARILVAIQNQVDQVKVQAAYSNLSEEAQNGINMLTTMV